MTLGQSLWVGASDDLVLSSLDARLAQGGFWGKTTLDALDVRTGVVWTGDQQLLAGRADLKVDVKRLHFLSSKGATNGAYLGVNKSVETVTVPAPPALGSRRIDVLWVAQRDKKATVSADPATLAEFGVIAGDAGSSPTKPTVPAGTEEVGTISWDSTSTVASGTNATQCTLATTCRWVVPTGCAIPVRSQAERDALTTYAGLRAMRLDLGGAIDTHDGTRWDDWVSAATAGFTAAAGFSGLAGNVRKRGGVVTVAFQLVTNNAIAAGNAANVDLINTPAAYRPGNPGPAQGGAFGGSWQGQVQGSVITLGSTTSGFGAGDTMSVLATYLL